MKSHRRRRALAAALSVVCLSLCASAAATAMPARDHVSSAGTPSKAGDVATAARWEAKARYYALEATGDTPADYPGMSRAAQDGPPATSGTVRTSVHDADDALPTVLAGLALLVALAGAGYTLLRT